MAAATAASFLAGHRDCRCVVLREKGARSPGVPIGLKRQPVAMVRVKGVQAVMASAPSTSIRRSLIPAEPEALLLGDVHVHRRRDDTDLPPISPEKLDQWMTDSITEIVKNIGEAPFLVHIFPGDRSVADSAVATPPSSSSSQSPLILKREPAVPGSWTSIRRRWDEGEWSTPDGVILVEELKGEEENRECGGRSCDRFDEACEKTWGLLVQGRGAECSACYILNTCRVRSLVGTCTHFCLVRAQCFGDTAEAQLKKAFLVRHHQQQ